MIDRIANFTLVACGVADLGVALLYFYDRQWYKGLYWLAAAVIVYAVIKGMR